jgi:ABC-type branched-subunit amino acid transport system permease subunit
VFAAQQTSVFPTDFDTPFLILIYAGLILGGAGSVAGAVVGGLVVAISLEFLRNPTEAGYVFYGVILLTMIVKLRPWSRLAAVLAATAVFGLIMRLIVGAISSSATAGDSQSTGWIHDILHDWVIVPRHPTTFGNIGFVALVAMLIALVQLRGRWRAMALVVTLYLAACVWEARLVTVPAITRQILIGAILIVMMNARPQGLLGQRRVEVV